MLYLATHLIARVRDVCLLPVYLPLRVTIRVFQLGKHYLPVRRQCLYSHRRGFDIEETRPSRRGEDACKFANGTRIRDHGDLWPCMKEANCRITDTSLQMALYRDPRSVAVSTYYHRKRQEKTGNVSVEEFAIEHLPLLCQWVAVRYILFSGNLYAQSEQFWYEDALVDPLAWHYRWFDFAGLQLPATVVKATAAAAANNDFSFEYKPYDEHPGQSNETRALDFEHMIGRELSEVAEDIMRQWLPAVLLAKLGV